MRGEPERHCFQAPAGDLVWYDWPGEGVGAPTLLLLHATGFHARLWDRVVAALPPSFRVIAPDLRGHGLSHRPPGGAGDWEVTAAEAAALAESVATGPLVVAGHSMGGYAAAWIAAHRPELVSAALLVDPVILAPDVYAGAAGQLIGDPAAHPVARRRNAWTNAEEMIARFAERPPYSEWQDEVLADYCCHGLVPTGEGETLELACPPVIEASCYMGSAMHDPHRWLSRIAVPVTVLRGRGGERASPMDFSVSPTWEGLAAAIPGGRDLHWPDCSHFIPMEAPDRVAALIAEQGGARIG